MGKLKFTPQDHVKANSKAPLYLRTRNITFTVLESLGDSNYLIQVEDDQFKVKGSHLDLVTNLNETPEFSGNKNSNPEGTQSVIDKMITQKPSKESKSESTKLSDKPWENLGSDLKPDVKKFIEQCGTKITKIEEEILPKRDEIFVMAGSIELAKKLNKVPSPKVWKMMHHMVELNPELGHNSALELYMKAESVLESTLA